MRAAELTRIVDGVRQQPQKPGPLDGLDDSGLLLSRGSCAARGVYLADGIEKARQHVEALVVDLLELELRGELFSGRPADGNSLLFGHHLSG